MVFFLSNLLHGDSRSVFRPLLGLGSSCLNSEFIPPFTFSTNTDYPLCLGHCFRLRGYCSEWNRQILAPEELTFQWERQVVNKYIIVR